MDEELFLFFNLEGEATVAAASLFFDGDAGRFLLEDGFEGEPRTVGAIATELTVTFRFSSLIFSSIGGLFPSSARFLLPHATMCKVKRQ